MDLTPGAVIAGRYRVERKVGSGGMGEVWAGEHGSVGSRVALKTLLSAAACNHEVVARFKREAYILGRIRSDHVARVVDFVADEDYGLVLVMEFIEGNSLSSILMERALTVEETIELGVDIACALIDLHQAHTVHRDLKPGNIILQPLPGERKSRAVVVDFGVSRLSLGGSTNDEEEITGITRADMAVGTIEYMAPEQILNSRNVTSASDIYAAGAILFRAVAGRHVFGNIVSDTELANKKLTIEPPPLSLPRDDALARGLTAVVTRALKRRPSERYKTAQELLDALLPLRDLARVVQVDLDAATLEPDSILHQLVGDQMHMRAQPPQPLPAIDTPTTPKNRSTAPPRSNDIAQPSSQGSGSLLDRGFDPKSLLKGRSVSILVLVASVLTALLGGLALGAGLFQRPRAEEGITPTTLSVSIPTAGASASGEPAQEAAAAMAASAPARASASAEGGPASGALDPAGLAASTTASNPSTKARPAVALQRPPKPAGQPPTPASASPSESPEPTVKSIPADFPDAATSH